MKFEKIPNIESEVEVVKQAAISFDGQIFTGWMHGEAFSKARSEMPELVARVGDNFIDGYVTSTGRFVTREEAGRLADEAGQLEHLDDDEKPGAARRLDSHDLPGNKKLTEDWEM
jgi:hypothetical protein